MAVSEYDYKGETWFVIVQDTLATIVQNPDERTHTKFLNKNCQLVCTWTKGGLVPVNKTQPDSIDKNKIRKLASPGGNNTNYAGDSSLPSVILSLASQLNSPTIQQYEYRRQRVYFFATVHLPAYELAKKGITTIEENYYDSDGKIIATFRRATASTFMRAQRWEPASFAYKELVPTKINWIRRQVNYVRE